MLDMIRANYENSSLKVKIELFLFPLFLVLLLFSFFDINTTKIMHVNYEKRFLKKFDGSLFEIIKDIEFYSSNKKIALKNISNTKKSINITGEASLLNIKKLIKKLELINKYSNIKSLSISKKNGTKYNFNIALEFKKLYIKRKYPIKESKKKQKKYKLIAIVGKNVLINNTWLLKGEKIDGYILSKVSNEYVLIKKNNKEHVLKVFKDEKIK